MEVDDDARFDIERASFFDLNQIVNVVGTVSSSHELTVRHTLSEDGQNGNCSMAKNEKANGQQPGRPPAEEALGLRHCSIFSGSIGKDSQRTHDVVVEMQHTKTRHQELQITRQKIRDDVKWRASRWQHCTTKATDGSQLPAPPHNI